ncbi:hypothetical protein [Pelosinus propionicus]|uniref:Uncharacterized protein n=1 Tax=Pelosinus propionicus DSM 13327 TaxID=1123291 RepID=A0A1I4MD92_9FIRM|nr:hypothetical protein [Pelosinus propionicus]SFM01244.1 hypothetical protein SAMN04490355_103249 [Pelosinus propionicus DSM 13327]
MSNQTILWSMIVISWFSLFLMKKKDIKRYMSVFLFTIVTGILILEVGTTLEWWIVKETAFPFQNFSNLYSLDPIVAVWLIRFLYGHFWLYTIIDAILNLGFVYGLLVYFYGSRDIFQFISISPFLTFLIISGRSLLLYGYQMWQEGIFSRSERTNPLHNLQPAAAKPIPQDEEDPTDYQ